MENSDKTKTRANLFPYLDSVLDASLEKFKTEKKSDEQRLKWGRLVTQTVQVYGDLLNDNELEHMAKDIEALKEKVGLKP